jgi:hypothetical protein
LTNSTRSDVEAWALTDRLDTELGKGSVSEEEQTVITDAFAAIEADPSAGLVAGALREAWRGDGFDEDALRASFAALNQEAAT